METISIRERIERVVCQVVGEIADVGRVYRWDMRGLVDRETGSMFDDEGQRLTLQAHDVGIAADDETAVEGGEGVELTEKTLPLNISIKLLQAEVLEDAGLGGEDAMTSAALHNRWLYRLEKAIANNADMSEKADGDDLGEFSGTRLAIDSRVTDTSQPPTDEGQREMITTIRIEVTYAHYRHDPAAGPGIVALTE